MPAVPPVNVDALRARVCGPGHLWTSVRVLSETGSTNADMASAARAGAFAGAVLCAEHQTSGRGRYTRQWRDVPGANVAVSVLLRPEIPQQRWGWLPLVAGLGVHRGLTALGVPDVELKWPNDVLLRGRAPGKVAGILAELVLTRQGPACVIGVGINVGLDVDELPVGTATSLALQGKAPDKTDLVAAVLDGWQMWQRRLETGEQLHGVYSEICGTVGREVRVQLDGENGIGELVTGLATGVDGHGQLLVRRADGSEVPVPAGDVFHVR